ncbi:LCP family protein [Paenibacillus sp. UNC451MF]|uniref:LCP family protein n=1 Tax=Paenibacillus sp. UNC451MF TaxID=1449063 RepID=UPI00068A98BC|nr:LCP family protein [Paenibacillus sp. UNC451MF]
MLKKIVKIALSCVLIGVASAGIYASVLYKDASEVIDKIGTPELVAEAESAKVKPLTLLMMGIDHRQDTGSLNSDVIMVVTVNPNTQSATVVSIPRDTQLTPKGLPERKANYYYPYFYNMNKDQAFGNTKKVFSELLDVPIDYAITVDFDGFRQAVDVLGGLTINVDMDMRYVDDEDGTNINLKKGISKLNGKQVLDFVRYRKSNMDTQESSDFARNARQQQVLNEMLKSVKTAGGITKLSQMIETVGNHMSTDVPSSQIREMIRTYFNMNPSNVNYVHLEGEWESPYVIIKKEELMRASDALKQQLGDTDTTDTDAWDKNNSITSNTYSSVKNSGNTSNVGNSSSKSSSSGKTTVSGATYGKLNNVTSKEITPAPSLGGNPLPFE